jgi:hypothetical protein
MCISTNSQCHSQGTTKADQCKRVNNGDDLFMINRQHSIQIMPEASEISLQRNFGALESNKIGNHSLIENNLS